MRISAVEAHFDDGLKWVRLQDGQQLGVPQGSFPRLVGAKSAEGAGGEIGLFGPHWEALDEEISVPALLAGKPVLAAE